MIRRPPTSTLSDTRSPYPTLFRSVGRLAALVQGAARHQLPGQQGGRSQLDKPLEDVADRSGLGLVDHQLAVDDVVPHRHEPAHPHALGAAGGELVADAFTGDLTFELGE